MKAATTPLAHQYDSLFYQYQREGSLRSARIVLPMVVRACQAKSLLDVGCGAGAWLSAAKQGGLDDFHGVDGDYVDRSLLMVEATRFSPRDISKAFDLGRRFDLVQCLEVAEHVPGASSQTLVDNIVRHGNLVLFSAAVPGQGGEDHINEQSYGYWRDLFAARGYRLFDFIRPRIADNLDIEPWYRYNVLLFVHDSQVEQLPAEVKGSRIADDKEVPDYSPLSYRIRKGVLRHLPNVVVSKMAVWKHSRAVRALQQQQGRTAG
jgi:SAM-dependent methyltransferase